MTENSKKEMDRYFERAKELEGTGLDWSHAHGIAGLEQRIRQWPEKWGDDFVILIFGDFEPLTEKFTIENLGITVFPELLEKKVITHVRTVHRATVKVSDKSIESVIDAIRRINVFLGTFVLVTWCNSYCSWWSFITHESGGGGHTKLSHEDLNKAIDGAISIKPELRMKVDSALYWLREPKNSMFSYQQDLLKTYAAYWNAFECLVDAVIIAKPRPKTTKDEKQELLDKLFEKHEKRVSAKFIQDAYISIVNPGLKQKAEHALNVCFGDFAQYFIDESFNIEDENNRLYNIRNAINHGEVDAENPKEHARIQSRLKELWIMIMGMFGRLIPYPYPVHRKSINEANNG